jgi:ribonuclease E
MSNRMLIDATHPEETRVVVLRGNRVEEFDFESASRKQLRGNIYLAKVTRVEPSLQAAFVDYGGNRHGFLAFSEIHPDYYQIPVADRQALIEDEQRAQRDEDEESNGNGQRSERRGRRGRHSRRGSNRNRGRDVVRSEAIDAEAGTSPADPQTPLENGDPFLNDAHAREAEAIEAGDTLSRDTPADDALSPADASGDVSTSGTPDADAQDSVETLPRLFSSARTDEDASTEDSGTGRAPISSATREDAGLLVETQPADADPAAETTAPVAEQSEAEPSESFEPAEQDDHGASLAAEDRDSHAGDAANGDEEDDEDDEDDETENGEEEETVESVGGDALEEVQERAPRYRKHYKIQEVIKRRQVMLVQVVKEERGTKGAALTTYLSLAGRYSVLMPNTARGGGISRKVTNAEDRKTMKEIAEELDVPEGMGVILRTAGASRTKLEVKRDFEYLLRLWETVRDLTLKSSAPTLVYEEGSLIKRAIRDLYHKDIEEIVVEGETAYREAKDFMRMLMPSHVKNVLPYSDAQPIFTRYGIESQLDAMFQPTVQLKSGGYIVINQTEALVAIDVNSGRATREHSIEETATKTNTEAAAEIARQLRLRDLAGLIVIDFIDMDEGRNNRSVERKMKEALKSDRARIQVGRISHFGLLEMSRQRIRSSVLESSTETCPHCGGTGHVRSVSSVALQLVRALEETLLKGATHNLIVRSRSDVAIYVLNHKRAHLRMLEERFKISIACNVDPTLTSHPPFAIDRGEQVMSIDQARAVAATIKPDSIAAYDGAEPEYMGDSEDEVLDEVETEGETEEVAAEGDEARERGGRKRRRRGRRGRGRDSERAEGDEDSESAIAAEGDEPRELSDDSGAEPADEDESDDSVAANGDADKAEADKRRRRRGRRGGRRNRRDRDGEGEEIAAQGAPESEDADANGAEDDVAEIGRDDTQAADEPAPVAPEVSAPRAPRAPRAAPEPAPVAAETEAPAPRRRSTVREAPPALSAVETVTPAFSPAASPSPEPQPAAADTAAETATDVEDKPRRFGWWSRKG